MATAQDMSTLSTQLQVATFSLVIAELAFPECAASDAVSVIRHVTTQRQGTPILVLTSNADLAAHRQARTLGVWDISQKPALCTELLGLIRNILEDAYPKDVSHLTSPGAAADRRERLGTCRTP